MFSLAKILEKNLLVWQIQAWHWSPVMSLHASSIAWRRGTCLWGAYCEPSTSMWRKTFWSGYSKERGVSGIQGDKLIGLKTWLLSAPLQGILGPLHWFSYGAPQNHIQWRWSSPQRTSFWDPLNRWALKLSSISSPASSKNMNGFHQLPALSPSKKTFTVGKTNTDNNDIEFWGICFSPINGHLETDHTWTYSVLGCFTFVMLFNYFYSF